TEVLALPAEGAQARDDVVKLQKELEEARKQGQAYARELAAVWSVSEDLAVSSSAPPPEAAATERHRMFARFAGGVAATLRACLAPVGRELSELQGGGTGLRKSAPDARPLARGDAEQRVESIRRRLLALHDFVAELAAVSESDPDEPARPVDLVEVARAQVRALDARAERCGVTVHVRAAPEDAPAHTPAIIVTLAPRACAALIRELLSHAISASPRGSSVVVSILARGREGLGPQVLVDDSGTALPESARRALLALEADPGTFGRPSSVALFVAAELAVAQGGRLDLGDAPQGSGGGVRAAVTFLR
ncbi:MAG: sensor histidine kinase, partial [Polyangiaceae bacterium]